MVFDTYIFHVVNGLASRFPLLDFIMVFFADYFAYFLVLVFILFLVSERDWRRRWHLFALSSLSVILSRGILTEAIRFFYYRARPFVLLKFNPLVSEAASSSMPSGHATFFFALAFAIFYFLKYDKRNAAAKRKWNWLFMGGAVIMGVARVFAGVHWPSDILAGAVIGFLSVFLIKKILPNPISIDTTRKSV